MAVKHRRFFYTNAVVYSDNNSRASNRIGLGLCCYGGVFGSIEPHIDGLRLIELYTDYPWIGYSSEEHKTIDINGTSYGSWLTFGAFDEDLQYVEEYDNVGESVQVTILDTGRTAKFTIDASYGTA